MSLDGIGEAGGAWEGAGLARGGWGWRGVEGAGGLERDWRPGRKVRAAATELHGTGLREALKRHSRQGLARGCMLWPHEKYAWLRAAVAYRGSMGTAWDRAPSTAGVGVGVDVRTSHGRTGLDGPWWNGGACGRLGSEPIRKRAVVPRRAAQPYVDLTAC